MIVRRCLALMILVCSLCLVQCLVIADGITNLRGMVLPERRLKEKGEAKRAVPPTKEKTAKTAVKKDTDTPTGPETTQAKPIATSTKTTKAPAKPVATTTTKTAAPTVATTETEKTEPPVDDREKDSAAQSDEMEQDDDQVEEAGPKSPQDGEASPEQEASDSAAESKLDDESQLHDESEPDSKSPTDKEQASTQQPDEAKSEEDEKEAVDDGQLKSKEDEPGGSGNPTPDATTDLCANATSCLECEQAAKNSTLDEEKTCVWKDSACRLVAKEDAPSDSRCDTNETTTQKVTPSVEYEEEEGSFVPGLAVVVLVVGLLALRKYIVNHDIIIPGVGGGIPGAFRQQGSSSLRSSRHTETVPLARSDDDEWGWDESGGDVELPTSRTQQKEKEDLEMAMALSLSVSPTAPMTSKAGVRMAPYPTKRSNSGPRTTPPSSGGDWDDWDDESPSSPRVAAPTQPAAIPKIASLGVRQPVVTRPKVAEKPKEDDIFASMGLAAKPKFSHRPPNAPASGARTAASPPFSSTLSAAAAVVGEDVGEDWDDDSDLDDLLDE